MVVRAESRVARLSFLTSPHMSAWDRIPFASAASVSDISVPGKGDERPIIARTESARDAGYDFLCVPLTTDAWKDRWRAMCVLPTASHPSDNGEEVDYMMATSDRYSAIQHLMSGLRTHRVSN